VMHSALRLLLLACCTEAARPWSNSGVFWPCPCSFVPLPSAMPCLVSALQRRIARSGNARLSGLVGRRGASRRTWSWGMMLWVCPSAWLEADCHRRPFPCLGASQLHLFHAVAVRSWMPCIVPCALCKFLRVGWLGGQAVHPPLPDGEVPLLHSTPSFPAIQYTTCLSISAFLDNETFSRRLLLPISRGGPACAKVSFSHSLSVSLSCPSLSSPLHQSTHPKPPRSLSPPISASPTRARRVFEVHSPRCMRPSHDATAPHVSKPTLHPPVVHGASDVGSVPCISRAQPFSTGALHRYVPPQKKERKKEGERTPLAGSPLRDSPASRASNSPPRPRKGNCIRRVGAGWALIEF
jgi:hypothetical protein